jgi:hypothetical protein
MFIRVIEPTGAGHRVLSRSPFGARAREKG